MNPRLLTIKELSDEIGVPVGTLQALRSKRLIPFLPVSRKIVRYDPLDVRAALQKHEIVAR